MRLLLGTAALLLLCGCSGSAEPNATPTETVTVTAPLEPKPSETTESANPFAPNLGEQALRVGQTREGSSVSTTLQELRYPYPPGEFRTPDPGQDFVGLRVRQCLGEDADTGGESVTGTFNGEWAAVTPNGNEFAGTGSHWNDWPAPKLPELVELIPGRCIQGWMTTQVPKGTKIETILWRPGGSPLAEWIAASA